MTGFYWPEKTKRMLCWPVSENAEGFEVIKDARSKIKTYGEMKFDTSYKSNHFLFIINTTIPECRWFMRRETFGLLLQQFHTLGDCFSPLSVAQPVLLP